MTSSELVSRFLIPQSILHLETHSFPHRTQITTLYIVKLLMCLPQENDPKFRAFAKHLCLLRAAVFRGVGGQVQIGDQRKISLLSNYNWQSLPGSCEDGFARFCKSANGWEFKASRPDWQISFQLQ